jgi:hypothetical protein
MAELTPAFPALRRHDLLEACHDAMPNPTEAKTELLHRLETTLSLLDASAQLAKGHNEFLIGAFDRVIKLLSDIKKDHVVP